VLSLVTLVGCTVQEAPADWKLVHSEWLRPSYLTCVYERTLPDGGKDYQTVHQRETGFFCNVRPGAPWYENWFPWLTSRLKREDPTPQRTIHRSADPKTNPPIQWKDLK